MTFSIRGHRLVRLLSQYALQECVSSHRLHILLTKIFCHQHHCDSTNPSGFCFINNVAVAAAHAHLKHGITHVVILDIDLHHGNGTQEIVWQINETARLRRSALAAGAQISGGDLQIYYGSLHDIEVCYSFVILVEGPLMPDLKELPLRMGRPESGASGEHDDFCTCTTHT